MNPLFALGMPGLPELLLIGVVALIFFGPKRLPELARGLRRGLDEFRHAKDDLGHEIEQKGGGSSVDEGTAPRQPASARPSVAGKPVA